MWGSVVAALLLLGVAAGLRHAGLRLRGQEEELRALPVETIADLRAEAATVVAELGATALARRCKVLGIGQATPPLVGPFSQQPVLYYEATVTHQWWQDHYSKDKKGRRTHRRTEHKKKISTERSDRALFTLQDATSSLIVDTTQADIDGLRTTLHQLRPDTSRPHKQQGSGTIGFLHDERALVPGEPLLLLGTLRAQPGTGELMLAVGPERRPRRLLVSSRAEAEVRRSARRARIGTYAASAASGLAAASVFVLGIANAVTDPGGPSVVTQSAERDSASGPTATPEPSVAPPAPQRPESAGGAQTQSLPPQSSTTPTAAASRPVSAAAALLQAAGGGDGDSWHDTAGREYRLGMINTPEVGECYADRATAKRKALVAAGFRARVYTTDKYGRSVAVVTTASGLNVNVHLARYGFANDRYLEQFRHENPALARQLDDAFAAAKREGRGLWSSCGGTTTRQAAPTSSRTAASAPGSGCHPAYRTCVPVKGTGSGSGSANDLDCPDIGKLVYLKAVGNDPYRLDANNDGVGCESYA